jgi:hypothetical protein
MISEICHQIGRYRKTEALKTKIKTLRPARIYRSECRSWVTVWEAHFATTNAERRPSLITWPTNSRDKASTNRSIG